MTTIVLDDLLDGRRHAVEARRLVVAGFTGRDAGSVARHLDELAAAGVPCPQMTPTAYHLNPVLVSQTPVVVIGSPHTSGEVEPVLVVWGGRRLLTVGSDHTDREIESRAIDAAKAACPKVVGRSCIDLAVLPDGAWDRIELRSELENSQLYQLGTLADLLPLDDLLAQIEDGFRLAEGDVVFLGTVPTVDGLRFSSTFRASLAIPEGPTLALDYRIVATTDGRLLAKPESEFVAVDKFPWVPVPDVSGQMERILAVDAATGIATRMLRFDPGCDTSNLGVLRHDFWEEVTILSGSLHDLTLDQAFGAGTYACRPPGMPHGPWRSPSGCITFEVRYPAR